jgi:LysR family glycine cleavage system transcriptional activator
MMTTGRRRVAIARKVLHAHRHCYVWFRCRFDERLFRISTSIFVAQELLLPNYLSFPDFFDDTELRIESGMSLVDFDTESIDATIRFGSEGWPNITSQKLCDIGTAPVFSPDYLLKNSIRQLADLKCHRLIMTSLMFENWEQ